ncbi:hypothetical protein C4K39_0037 [Pseudomonas sessilinigenes]|nr:hypothetical protein C4K39_0037 [Pseudomonas sessilinigenes]
MCGSRVVFHGGCKALETIAPKGFAANVGQAASVSAAMVFEALWLLVGCC